MGPLRKVIVQGMGDGETIAVCETVRGRRKSGEIKYGNSDPKRPTSRQKISNTMIVLNGSRGGGGTPFVPSAQTTTGSTVHPRPNQGSVKNSALNAKARIFLTEALLTVGSNYAKTKIFIRCPAKTGQRRRVW
jgi:hypothetical protein